MGKIITLMYIVLLTVILTPFIGCMYVIHMKSVVVKSEKKLKNLKFNVPEVNTKENKIPKHIYQCYKTRADVPDKIIDNIKKLNPDWEYHFYDDNMCLDFLKNNYGQEYVDKFNNIKRGAHKADLWRYCLLYLHGGVYVDIDLEMLVPFDSIIDNETFIVPYTNTAATRIVNGNNIYNALIITKPGHPIIYDSIQRIMKTSEEHMRFDYLVNVRRIKTAVKKFLKTNKLKTMSYPDEKTKILHEYLYKLPFKYAIYDYSLNKKIANSKYDNYVYSGDNGVFT